MQGKNMQIILQSGFLTFVRRYCNEDFGTTQIFRTINDYFFKSKEVNLRHYEEYIRNEADLKNYCKEGIFISEKDKDRLSDGLLDTHERIILVQDIIKKEKIIICVKLFKQLLTEFNINLYLTYHSVNTINKTVQSSDIFITESKFYELLYNNFEMINGAYIKFLEDDLINSMNIFFKEFKKDDSAYIDFRKNEDVNMFFRLYVEKEAEMIFKNFANDADWRSKNEEDCKVSRYLQNAFCLPQTKVNKYVLPMLSNVRSLIF